MTDKKTIPNDIRKALLQQQMNLQRKALQEQIRPLLKTGKRIQNLFVSEDKQAKNKTKTIALTSIAVFLAVLGKRRGGWLGQAARYIIINYPGLFHKFMK